MKSTHVFWLIMLGVTAWGIFLAVGSYLGGIDPAGGSFLRHDVRRSLVILACVAGFLTFWALMLRSRERRLQREEHEVR
jgi:membrane protein DedA with SNARE-associated domain